MGPTSELQGPRAVGRPFGVLRRLEAGYSTFTAMVAYMQLRPLGSEVAPAIVPGVNDEELKSSAHFQTTQP